jgi:ABC-type dipeptide/oligopeptide/nickel transport system permease subunit
VFIVNTALAAGHNGVVLMTGFTIIGLAVGGPAGYNMKKVKEMISQVPNLEGSKTDGEHGD